MTIPAKTTQAPTPQTIEDVLIKGDLSNLNPDQRKEYYLNVCRSLGLNPLTQPFTYLTLNGRLMLYANRTCSDQLRRVQGISIEIVSQDYKDGVLSVHVRAKDREGRQDEELGVVSMNDQLKGEARANTIMKAITKAKRRVTLSIAGLGWTDETEVEDIPKAAKGPSVDPETGEILEAKPKPTTPTWDGKELKALVEPPSKAAEALTSIAKDSIPHELKLDERLDRASAWIAFGQQMIQYARTNEWLEWAKANALNITTMENEAPKVHARMVAAIKKATEAAE